MIYTPNIQKAIEFAIKVHEIDMKQKRKGKDVPYITHPFTVALILAKAGAKEEVIIAGILHDTVEDSNDGNKITKEIISENFGEEVASLVMSVTENEKALSWEERKAEALGHIKNFSNDSVLVKSADIISNVSEIRYDYEKDGDKMFERFHKSKEETLENYSLVARELISRYGDSPLREDLDSVIKTIESIL